MNILVVTQYYYPERFLINDITAELVKRGHNVTVLTGVPNYPSGIIPKEYRKNKIKEEEVNGAKVLRCPIVPRGKSRIKLLINYFSFMFKANRRVKKIINNDFDLVFLYQLTPIFAAYPAITISKKKNIPLLCYCLDLAPLSGFERVGKLFFFKRFYKKFSKWAYNNCSHIAVTSKSFIDYLAKIHNIPENKMSYIPQHALDTLSKLDLSKEANDTIEFLYAGNMGKGPRLENILLASEILINKNICNFCVKFVGDGTQKESLIEMAKKKNVTNIFFQDSVPMEKMPSIYKNADALLVTLKKGQIAIPSKVQSYMAAGKPIIASMDGAGKDLICEAKCGLCVEAENPNALAEIMERYINNPSDYADCGKNGKDFYNNNMTLDIFMEKILNLMDSLKKR